MELLVSIVASVAISLVASELYDWSGKLSRLVLKRAIAKLPEQSRERLSEEWASHLAECEGKVSKLFHALGCFRASLILRGYGLSSIWQYVSLYAIEVWLTLLLKLYWTSIKRDVDKDEELQKKYLDVLAGVALVHGIRVTWFSIAQERDED